MDEVLRFGIQVADALTRAHRAGIVHRDLKPGNIMLARSGAKLLDFGLARNEPLVASAAPDSHSPTMSRSLTAEGTIVGTFQYMAPEQLEGKEADSRTDIFAFGAVLYEMATGRKAFEGQSQASLIASILKEQPRPIADVQPLPAGLDRVVRACLPGGRADPERPDVGCRSWIMEGTCKGAVHRVRPPGRRRAALAGDRGCPASAAAGWRFSSSARGPPHRLDRRCAPSRSSRRSSGGLGTRWRSLPTA
jgi:serine/threonine protein kinase